MRYTLTFPECDPETIEASSDEEWLQALQDSSRFDAGCEDFCNRFAKRIAITVGDGNYNKIKKPKSLVQKLIADGYLVISDK